MATLESIDNNSRVKARKMMKRLHPNMRSDQVIHHIDGNPLNNAIENLLIMTIKEHKAIHSMFKLPNRIAQVRKPGFRPLTIKGFPPELHARLKTQAKKESTAFNKVQIHKFIIMLLERAITEREGETDGK